jgi:hypothetical protein
MTSPPTAILYIAEDSEYMTQLKDTLHVKEVEIGMNNKYLFIFNYEVSLLSSSSWP